MVRVRLFVENKWRQTENTFLVDKTFSCGGKIGKNTSVAPTTNFFFGAEATRLSVENHFADRRLTDSVLG
jgi:hypothetical protein